MAGHQIHQLPRSFAHSPCGPPAVAVDGRLGPWILLRLLRAKSPRGIDGQSASRRHEGREEGGGAEGGGERGQYSRVEGDGPVQGGGEGTARAYGEGSAEHDDRIRRLGNLAGRERWRFQARRA